MGATAATLRDDRDNFLAAQCKFIMYVANVITTKAMAIRDVLKLANYLGYNRIEAESKSLQVLNFCIGQTRWWDTASTKFTECMDTTTMIGCQI